MTAEWLTAYSTAGTLLVILATAAAALVQLRHARSSNQIAALNEIRERIESAEFRDAEYFVSYELPRHYENPGKFPDLFSLPLVGQYRAITIVGNFFENVGLFVKHNVIDRELTCDAWNVLVLRNWKSLAPMISYTRKQLGDDSILENFEYLAALCESFREKHPSVYPRNARRMPEDRTLIDAART